MNQLGTYLGGALVAAISFVGVEFQLTLGSISGTVREMSGGIVPVRVIATSGDERWRSVSREDGTYRIDLPPGTYRLEATISGFVQSRFE